MSAVWFCVVRGLCGVAIWLLRWLVPVDLSSGTNFCFIIFCFRPYPPIVFRSNLLFGLVHVSPLFWIHPIWVCHVSLLFV